MTIIDAFTETPVPVDPWGDLTPPCTARCADDRHTWTCTRTTGHDGPHVATYFADHVEMIALAWT